MDDYRSTTVLPDDKGIALLTELERLYAAIGFDEETNKKVRRGSHAKRWATAELQKAIIDAGAQFERHEEFTEWLLRNGIEYIEAYDPIRGRSEQVNAIRNLEWEVKHLKQSVENLRGIILKLELRLPQNEAA